MGDQYQRHAIWQGYPQPAVAPQQRLHHHRPHHQHHAAQTSSWPPRQHVPHRHHATWRARQRRMRGRHTASRHRPRIAGKAMAQWHQGVLLRQGSSCYRCGRVSRRSHVHHCRAIFARCHHCHTMSHLARVCRSTASPGVSHASQAVAGTTTSLTSGGDRQPPVTPAVLATRAATAVQASTQTPAAPAVLTACISMQTEALPTGCMDVQTDIVPTAGAAVQTVDCVVSTASTQTEEEEPIALPFAGCDNDALAGCFTISEPTPVHQKQQECIETQQVRLKSAEDALKSTQELLLKKRCELRDLKLKQTDFEFQMELKNNELRWKDAELVVYMDMFYQCNQCQENADKKYPLEQTNSPSDINTVRTSSPGNANTVHINGPVNRDNTSFNGQGRWSRRSHSRSPRHNSRFSNVKFGRGNQRY